jgi:hypothetical protein
LFSKACKFPILLFFVSQSIGIGVGYLIYLVTIRQGYNPSLLIIGLAGIAGVLAALIGSRVFELPWWWIVINLAFPVGVALSLTLSIDPWVYFAGFAVLLLINWNAGVTRVPLYLTNPKTWHALGNVVAEEQAASFVDLGSGLGGTLFALAKSRPECTFTGFETAPVPFLISSARQLLGQFPNVRICYGSIWDADLSQYDVVYCFLSPVPMPRLHDKARAEMRTDCLLISNTFHVENFEPDRTIVIEDGRKTNLLIWRL